MHASSRDLRLILLGICLAWTVGDAMVGHWRQVVIDVIFTIVMGGLVWPIEIFDRRE